MPWRGFKFDNRQQRSDENEFEDLTVSNDRFPYVSRRKAQYDSRHANYDICWQDQYGASVDDTSSVALSEIERMASAYSRRREIESSFVPMSSLHPSSYLERGGHKRGNLRAFKRLSNEEYDGLHLYTNPQYHPQPHHRKNNPKIRGHQNEPARYIGSDTSFPPRRSITEPRYNKAKQKQKIQSKLIKEIQKLTIPQLIEQLQAVRDVKELPRVVLTDGKDEDLFSVVSILTTPRETRREDYYDRVGRREERTPRNTQRRGEGYRNTGQREERMETYRKREEVQKFIIPEVRRKYPPIRKLSDLPKHAEFQEANQELKIGKATDAIRVLRGRNVRGSEGRIQRQSRPVKASMGSNPGERRTQPPLCRQIGIQQIKKHGEQQKSMARAQGLAVNLDVDDCDLSGFYTGTLDDDGLPTGMGVIKFENNDMYIGEFWRGKMHGRGTFMFEGFLGDHGAVLKGNFVKNRFSM